MGRLNKIKSKKKQKQKKKKKTKNIKRTRSASMISTKTVKTKTKKKKVGVRLTTNDFTNTRSRRNSDPGSPSTPNEHKIYKCPTSPNLRAQTKIDKLNKISAKKESFGLKSSVSTLTPLPD